MLNDLNDGIINLELSISSPYDHSDRFISQKFKKLFEIYCEVQSEVENRFFSKK